MEDSGSTLLSNTAGTRKEDLVWKSLVAIG